MYLNVLDQFIKHTLRERYYIRYTDDFIIVADNEQHLHKLISLIQKFLNQKLKLELHPKKVIVRKLSQGIDFLGYNILPHYTLVRTKTRRRIMKNAGRLIDCHVRGDITKSKLDSSIQSYYGVLYHASARKLLSKLKKRYYSRLPLIIE